MVTVLQPRAARPAAAAWNVTKTLAEMAIVWAFFFAALPWLCWQAEPLLGLDSYRYTRPGWFLGGVVLLIAGSVLHLVADLVLALLGAGTPLYWDAPRRLVIAGPYRYVRNPMAIGGLAQGAGVALMLGSPLALVYAVMLSLLENFLVRPAEERDLERRFGDAYRLYRRRVRCWRPRLGGFDPARETAEPPLAAEYTTPPGHNVVLYDGLCKFCTAGAKQLIALARPGSSELVSFQEPGVLERFEGIPLAACMRQMHLVAPDGRVYGGFESAVRVVATRRGVGWLAYAYYLPGLRLLCDLLYALIAANRYRILGKAVAAGACEGGTCGLHFPPPQGLASARSPEERG